ncbi:MAG: hypothetical protein O2788_03100 [Chloroflexi bacterium]|nr:hypothetical protein [Chloroflexota bacterium]
MFKWLSSLDRSYVFALSAFFSALFATIALSSTLITRQDADQATKLLSVLLVILPLFIVVTPLVALPRQPGPRFRHDKVNSLTATVILTIYVGMMFNPIGVFYLPALVFSVSSSVSMFFGRKKYATAEGTADIRVSGSRPRMSGNAVPESRRRKKRNRK